MGCDATAEEYLRSVLDITDEDDLDEAFEKVCDEARINSTEFEYGDIFHGKGEMFEKEYYDGGTGYNWKRETLKHPGSETNPAYVLEDDLGRINGIYNKVAEKRRIEFPSYLPNFEECEYNVAMCCFVQDRQANDDNGNCATPYDENCVDEDPADNTDICYVDMERSQGSSHVAGGHAIFNEGIEGDTHCHGIAWADDESHPSSVYKGNNLFYVSLYDHLYTRGYVRNVPGAPMCSCLEQSAVVSRADCTEIQCNKEHMTLKIKGYNMEVNIRKVEIDFNACEGVDANNDLKEYYRQLVEDGLVEDNTNEVTQILVGDTNNRNDDADEGCATAIENFLQ
eukprot:CAMPEP_0184858592 /NCGR_PEP_ID=MMETSP0580-20130426/3677_1 /TAXON_ID=1118495 /ORGANISM="Dactyliosolen fragilissimus" /LENGTH=338 /DNA_ID=CAMNT_0027354821 /DNA_START=273 /DNA_END=1289 /DNA_ORIENTATION=+